jgi:hypothetical protein
MGCKDDLLEPRDNMGDAPLAAANCAAADSNFGAMVSIR